MNPQVHAQISVKRCGGVIDDYYPIHFFMDSTKELCSDNRHRILHTLWGIRRVVIPIFGHTITNSDGKQVNIKDLCEYDHILPDYNMRFIPTLTDFVDAIDTTPLGDWQDQISAIHTQYQHLPAVRELLFSPLSITGKLESLLLTHNSWFLNAILPRIMDVPPRLESVSISPATFFNAMSFKLWMANGSGLPPSAQKLQQVEE